jgi:hypothetical protein
MADDLDEQPASKIAPELRKALPVSILLQSLLLVFAAFFLDGGWLLVMTVIAVGLFWAWFMFLVFLRGEKPTHLDLLAVKWGFPAIWIAAFYLAEFVGKMRGA